MRTVNFEGIWAATNDPFIGKKNCEFLYQPLQGITFKSLSKIYIFVTSTEYKIMWIFIIFMPLIANSRTNMGDLTLLSGFPIKIDQFVDDKKPVPDGSMPGNCLLVRVV